MGLDVAMDILQARKTLAQAEVQLITTIEQAVSVDMSINSNRESARNVVAQQGNVAAELDFGTRAPADHDVLIAQVAAARDALA